MPILSSLDRYTNSFLLYLLCLISICWPWELPFRSSLRWSFGTHLQLLLQSTTLSPAYDDSSVESDQHLLVLRAAFQKLFTMIFRYTFTAVLTEYNLVSSLWWFFCWVWSAFVGLESCFLEALSDDVSVCDDSKNYYCPVSSFIKLNLFSFSFLLSF